jgi:deazaflavin-dependent oxidoreductase (nitroreductase family)
MSSPSPFAAWEQDPYCYLTTVGRVSGRPHTIEIWFVVEAGSAWLLTEPDGGTDWVRNLRREPQVRLRVGAVEVDALAAVVDLPAHADVRRALADRYRHTDDDLDAWAAGALAVRVTPRA